jgi:hypothetical protein
LIAAAKRVLEPLLSAAAEVRDDGSRMNPAQLMQWLEQHSDDVRKLRP